MTPAVKTLEKAGVPFQLHAYDHDPEVEAYGVEAAEKLGLDPSRLFKTLVVRLDAQKLVLGLIPVAARLDLKALARSLGAKRAEMSDPVSAQRATGYVVGGISPLGGKTALTTVLDSSALTQTEIFVSAGKRGLQVEMAPQDLIRLTKAIVAPLTVLKEGFQSSGLSPKSK